MKIRIGALLVVLLTSMALAGCGGAKRSAGDRLFYVPLGASDAVGIGASPLSEGYVYRIESALEARGPRVDLLNLGIPGAMARDIRQALETALRLDIGPDLVTVWTGANDLIAGVEPDDFEERLEEILDDLRDETDALIFLADLPDLTRLPRFLLDPRSTVTRERIDRFNAIIYEQSEKFEVPVVRLSEQPITDDLTSDVDGFHPSNEGHREIAEAFLRVILPAFGLD